MSTEITQGSPARHDRRKKTKRTTRTIEVGSPENISTWQQNNKTHKTRVLRRERKTNQQGDAVIIETFAISRETKMICFGTVCFAACFLLLFYFVCFLNFILWWRIGLVESRDAIDKSHFSSYSSLSARFTTIDGGGDGGILNSSVLFIHSRI